MQHVGNYFKCQNIFSLHSELWFKILIEIVASPRRVWCKALCKAMTAIKFGWFTTCTALFSNKVNPCNVCGNILDTNLQIYLFIIVSNLIIINLCNRVHAIE